MSYSQPHLRAPLTAGLAAVLVASLLAACSSSPSNSTYRSGTTPARSAAASGASSSNLPEASAGAATESPGSSLTTSPSPSPVASHPTDAPTESSTPTSTGSSGGGSSGSGGALTGVGGGITNPPTPPAGWATQTDKQLGLSLCAPDKWKSTATATALSVSDAAGGRIDVRILGDTSGATINTGQIAFDQTFAAFQKKQQPGLTSRTVQLTGGVTAYQLTYLPKPKVTGDPQVRFTDTFFSDALRTYRVDGAWPQKSDATYQPIYDRLLTCLRTRA